MTDRVRHLTVTLDEDNRDDDVEAIVKTIQMIRGVANVETVVVARRTTSRDRVFRSKRLQCELAERSQP